MADVAAQIEGHIQRALERLQTSAVRANASWLPGLPAVTEQLGHLERAAASELLERVAEDRLEIAGAFNDGCDLGALDGVELGRSDPHNGRRTVAFLRFADGPTIVYKPRSVATEAAFSRLADWVAATDEDLAPWAPKTLERPGYGYCEYIPHRPCRNAQDVDRFYFRLGTLARLLQAVRGTDCHPENFVAARDWPVLVDAETLLHPRLGATPIDPLLATEILPSRTTTSRGQEIVYRGFDAPFPGSAGRPVLDGRAHSLAGREVSFHRGVARMNSALRDGETSIDVPDGPLQLLPGTCTRVVLRPTELYGRLLAHRLSARSLAAEDGGWPTVQRLLRRYEDVTLGPETWDAVREVEQAALRRADIPYFSVDAYSGDLLGGNGDLLAAKAFRPAGTGVGTSSVRG